jgi:hypothetical protein
MARVLLFLLKFKDPPPDLNNGKRKLKKRVER